MLDREYDTMRHAEDSHWWYRVLRRETAREILRLAAGRPDARILDAGCGTGGMLDGLRKAGPGWRLGGIDRSPHAVELARARGFDGVREGDIAGLPWGAEEFDGIVSLDVLYHRKVDEAAATREFLRTLKPGGFLVTNLPAFDILRGSHDIAVSGVRRYTLGGVRALLGRAGFAIERNHYWNAWLFVPALAHRLATRLRSPRAADTVHSDLAVLPGFVNAAAAAIGGIDFALCRALRIPFGTSVFSVARKPAA